MNTSLHSNIHMKLPIQFSIHLSLLIPLLYYPIEIHIHLIQIIHIQFLCQLLTICRHTIIHTQILCCLPHHWRSRGIRHWCLQKMQFTLQLQLIQSQLLQFPINIFQFLIQWFHLMFQTPNSFSLITIDLLIYLMFMTHSFILIY